MDEEDLVRVDVKRQWTSCLRFVTPLLEQNQMELKKKMTDPIVFAKFLYLRDLLRRSGELAQEIAQSTTTTTTHHDGRETSIAEEDSSTSPGPSVTWNNGPTVTVENNDLSDKQYTSTGFGHRIMTTTGQTRTLINLDHPTVAASSSSFDRGFNDGVVKEKRDIQYKQNGINQSEQFADIGDYCYTNFDDHLKQNVDVIIGHVQSPAEFHVIQHSVYGDYLQLTDELETLDAVLIAAGVSLGQMSIGQPCAARYDVDEKLYRAEIRNVGAMTSSIFFVDYGNMAFVSNDQLFPLPKALIRLPCAAIQCSLADADKRQLTHEMVEAFKVDVQEGDEAVIQPIGKRGQRIWKVNLFNKEGRQLTLQQAPLLTGEAEGMYSR